MYNVQPLNQLPSLKLTWLPGKSTILIVFTSISMGDLPPGYVWRVISWKSSNNNIIYWLVYWRKTNPWKPKPSQGATSSTPHRGNSISPLRCLWFPRWCARVRETTSNSPQGLEMLPWSGTHINKHSFLHIFIYIHNIFYCFKSAFVKGFPRKRFAGEQMVADQHPSKLDFMSEGDVP